LTLTAHTFTLTSLETGTLIGLALVAPEARYCSLFARRVPRLQRRYPSPRLWRAIEQELQPGLDASLWPADSALVRALDVTRSVAVRYLSGMDVAVPAVGAADVLDRTLTQQAAAAGMRLQQRQD
jgi:hypothetical protein